MGKAGINQLSSSVKDGSVRNLFGSTGQRMRERFQRDED
jgi:hypothetical protein